MLEAIVLGIVQGLTEFLPVSSSGHLVVVPYLVPEWDPPGLVFSAALHGGTLLALIVFFAGDVWYLLSRPFGIGAESPEEAARARRTVGLLALASVPAALAGFFLEDFFADTFEQPRLVSGFLIVTALMLVGAERIRARRVRDTFGATPEADVASTDLGRDESTVGWVDAVVIGSAQALAIFPGISRSGSTIATGMVRGMSRAASARFSFLLSIPIIAGATAYQSADLVTGESSSPFSSPEIAAGVVAAGLSGYWAIRFLLRLVQTDDLTGFARYVAFLGVLTFIGTLWLGNPSSI